MAHEPAGGEPRYLLQRPRLLEEVRRPGHDLQLLLRAKPSERLLVHADHGHVVTADDEKRWRLDEGQGVAREVGSPTARDDRADLPRVFGRSDQRSSGARAGAEVADPKVSCLGVIYQPLCGAGESLGEEPDVETEVAGAEVRPLFVRGEEVDQERREARFLERPRDEAVSGAVAARARAVGEEHNPSCVFGRAQISFEHDLTGRDPHRAFHHQPPCLSVGPGSSRLALSSSSMTSSSEVCEKSLYQKPIAPRSGGASRQTSSSTSGPRSSAVWAAHTGAARTRRRGSMRRRALIAALAVTPVARPSSTRITVRPLTSGVARSPRNRCIRRPTSAVSRSVMFST